MLFQSQNPEIMVGSGAQYAQLVEAGAHQRPAVPALPTLKINPREKFDLYNQVCAPGCRNRSSNPQFRALLFKPHQSLQPAALRAGMASRSGIWLRMSWVFEETRT